MDERELQQRYPTAFMDGAKARLRGKDIDQNPFTVPCSPTIRTEYQAWESGFINVATSELLENEG